MKASPLVSIIVPNFNGKRLLKECLDSIKNLNYTNLEVVIVDNSSTDGSIEMVKNDYPWARWLVTQRIAVGKACNRGMRIAKGDVIVTMLNNDMTVDKYWLDDIVSTLERKDVGVVGGKILYYGTDLIQSAGGWIDWNVGTGGQIGNGEKDKGQYDTLREVDYVDVPTVRRDVMNRIDGIDEEYNHYFVDTDYCVRAKKAGYKVLYVPSAVSWHRSSATFGSSVKRQYYSSQRDSIRFLIKHSPAPAIYYRMCCRLWYLLKTLAINLYKGKPSLICLQLRAILWNLVNLPKTVQSRYSNPILDDQSSLRQ